MQEQFAEDVQAQMPKARMSMERCVTSYVPYGYELF